METITKNEQETYHVAAEIAQKATGGDIFLLRGDLGSGKTTFTRGFAMALGVQKTVTSPTFVIEKQYLVSAHPSIKRIIHVDCYRLESYEDLVSIGLEENFKRDDVVILLEWPEKISDYLPSNAKSIQFQYLGQSERKITY